MMGTSLVHQAWARTRQEQVALRESEAVTPNLVNWMPAPGRVSELTFFYEAEGRIFFVPEIGFSV